MSAGKYSSIFSRPMEAIVVFETWAMLLGYSEVLVGEYSVT